MPQLAVEACNAAVAQGGVAVLVLPHDIGSQPARDLPINAFLPADRGHLQAPTAALESLREKIRSARRITLFVGEGARAAGSRILALAEHLRAPIVRSLKAKDFIPEAHPLFAGGLGLLGDRGGVTAMHDCDLLLMFGTDFPYAEWIHPAGAVIQIDSRPLTLGRRHPGVIGVHADVPGAVDWLLAHTPSREGEAHAHAVAQSRAAWEKLLANQEDPARSRGMVHPQAVAAALARGAADDAVFTCDTGEVTVWGARHLHLRAGQRFTLSFNLASMAYALPAALGAQLTWPRRQVVALAGDGGFNMLMGDFLTAIKYALPIKVVVFNNGKLGLIQMEEEAEGLPEEETLLQNPDYTALAAAMGGKGFRINRPDEIEPVLRLALAEPGPVIVDAVINPKEITWPPKIGPGQAMGFGLAKLKEIFAK
jgi:thiamine pyrophosphate-dependent acetolactate synthase large subunit-like protein